jgi:arabinofuranosyltransferase
VSRRAVILALLTLFAMAIVQCAWLCDDAFITLRTVDNLFHGYGLRWNPAERVQTFTHPLWMLILCAGRLLTGESFYSTHFLSIVIAMAMVALLCLRARTDRWQLAWGLALLLFSRSYLSYATSGLENPVTNLLLALFLLLWLQAPERVFFLALVACLGMLNRLDTALLFGPPLAVALWRRRSRRTVLLALAAFAPLAAWELFSLGYYGFLFPNTAYAKLSTGIAASSLAMQGLRYFRAELIWDPLALVVIGLGLYAGRRSPVAIGIALYLLYVLKIGGDFMAGRFFVAPMVCAVVLLLHAPAPAWKRRLAPLPLLGLVSVVWNPWFWWTGRRPEYHAIGITDERVYAYHVTGLLATRPDLRHNYLANFGIEKVEKGEKLIVENSIGQVGFYAGPTLHILDNYALGDPLLSRLPIANPAYWRIGHFRRRIPHGYEPTLLDGKNEITDPALAEYWSDLERITRGPLFSADRWRAIARMNLGTNDHLIADYIARGQPGSHDQ